MNKTFKLFGEEITIGPPTYAKLTAALIPQILLIASIMLVLSYTFSFYLILKELGTPTEPLKEGIAFWVRLPATFIFLILIALMSLLMDEIQQKREKKRYSKLGEDLLTIIKAGINRK